MFENNYACVYMPGQFVYFTSSSQQMAHSTNMYWTENQTKQPWLHGVEQNILKSSPSEMAIF